MKRKELYRLPNSKYTTSQIKQIREWHKIMNRLKKEFGLITCGYNPGFQCHTKGYTDHIELSVNMANILLGRIDELKSQIKELARTKGMF